MSQPTPVFDKENVKYRAPEHWPKYRKTSLTSAIRIDGPFYVVTSESDQAPFWCKDGYLAMDARGYPYAIATEEFERIYEKAEE